MVSTRSVPSVKALGPRSRGFNTQISTKNAFLWRLIQWEYHIGYTQTHLTKNHKQNNMSFVNVVTCITMFDFKCWIISALLVFVGPRSRCVHSSRALQLSIVIVNTLLTYSCGRMIPRWILALPAMCLY